MKSNFVNRLDSTKSIAMIAGVGLVFLILGIITSSKLIGKLLFAISAFVIIVAVVLAVRGVLRRLHLISVDLQKVLSVTDGIEKRNADVDSALQTVQRRTLSIPNIAGSVSKGRALQVAMSGVLKGLAEEHGLRANGGISSAQITAVDENLVKKRVMDQVAKHEETRAQTAEVKWQLDHELVLPHNVEVKNLDAVSQHRRLSQRVKAAAIMDPFSFGSFGPELDIVPLQPNIWREQFEENSPEIFICESAWQGVPAGTNPWKAQIYASVNFNYENRKNLLQILEYCKKNNIPTVFWNKEDPTHFTDRVNDFVATAKLFDFVFTTAEEVVPEYDKLMGRSAAHCLPFAVQPRIFHPALVHTNKEENGVVFAGSWYKKHEDRKILQGYLLDECQRAGLDLAIFDRYAGKDNEQFGFPDKYKKYIHPAVPFEKTAALYQKYKYGISINTVIDSETMLARRAFEMAATGCGIITNGTPATRHFFGDAVLNVAVGDRISKEDLDALDDRRLSLMNNVLSEHTYEKRVQALLRTVGISALGATQKVSVVVWVENLDEISKAKASFYALGAVGGNLLLVVSKKVETHRVQEFYKRGIDSVTSVVSEQYWYEYGVRTQTLFDFPYVYVSSNVNELATGSQIQRALNHAVYSPDPVKPAPEAVWPKPAFGDASKGTVMSVAQFDYLMKNGFGEGMMNIV